MNANMNSKEYVYLNGKMFLKEEGKVSVTESALIYGLAIYETILVLNGKALFWEEHQERLQKGLERIRISTLLLQDLKEKLLSLLKLNVTVNGRVRITVSRGEMANLDNIHQKVEGMILITVSSLTEDYEAYLMNQKKMKLKLYTKYRSYKPLPSYMKLTGLSNAFLIALMEMKSAGFDDVIFCNYQGYLSEGTTFNLFWIKNEKWYTPSLEVGILSGVVRNYLLKVLKEEGIMCYDGFYKSQAIYEADEVFISNSVRGIVAIEKVDDVEYKKEEKTQWLIRKYWQGLKELSQSEI